jgi:hypothetical protein
MTVRKLSQMLFFISIASNAQDQPRPAVDESGGDRWFIVELKTAPTSAGHPRVWGEQSGPFRLSISTDKEMYQVGDLIHLSAVIKNASDHPTYFARVPPILFYEMEIRLPSPDWIPWRPTAVLTEAGQEEKRPGESSFVGYVIAPSHEVLDQFELNRLYHMSTPGTYHIQFSCKLPLRYRGDPFVSVISNDLKLTVLPETR